MKKVLDHGFVELVDHMPQENLDKAIVDGAQNFPCFSTFLLGSLIGTCCATHNILLSVKFLFSEVI